MISLLLAVVLGQTPELHLPTKPVPLGRQVIMSIDAPSVTPYGIEWIVIDRGNNDDPLDNYLFIDSSKLKASLPSGLEPTNVTVNVVISTLENGAITTKLLKGRVDIGPALPPLPPGPTPPVPPLPPTPPPTPTPVIPDGKYKLAQWTYDQLKSSTLAKAQMISMAEKFEQVAGMISNGAFTDPAAAVAAVNSGLGEIIAPDRQAWIDTYLEPLRVKLNSLNPIIIGVKEQAISYQEIAQGLRAAGGGQ